MCVTALKRITATLPVQAHALPADSRSAYDCRFFKIEEEEKKAGRR